MQEKIIWCRNCMAPTEDPFLSLLTLENAGIVRDYHRSFPQYSVTALYSLPQMAKFLSVDSLYVKDESERFDLNSFKVLGGSFAIAKYIAQKLNKPISEIGYEDLKKEKIEDKLGKMTFFTATDGNHGRGVAWTAARLGQKAVVRMPKGTTNARLENIRNEGATVSIEDMNYDDCVRMAAKEAANCTNGVLIQDTSWQGYEDIPKWIMQGYTTMAYEAAEFFPNAPTHVFIQAGVGSLAAAVIGFYSNLYSDHPPIFTLIESSAADCFYRSALCGTGEIIKINGEMKTIMAGLACGEPNPIAWNILRNHVAVFVSCPDWVSALGMRMLAAPLKGDTPITSGESGAVGLGLLAAMKRGEYQPLRALLGLNENSRVLLFSTEGDTDPERYRNIVWNDSI